MVEPPETVSSISSRAILSLAFVAVELGLSIILMTLLGKWLKLSPKLTSLLAIGSCICGVSAIIAAKGGD